MGRPPHLPTPTERRQVEAMAGYGIPEADIARVLDIDTRTLSRDYAAELETGSILANAKVAESLFRRATGDGRQAVTAAIFWLKTRAGWRDAPEEPVRAPSTVTIVRFADQPYDAPARPALPEG